MPTVGVDVGGTSIRAGLVDGAGTVLDLVRRPTPRTADELDESLTEAVRVLTDDRPVDAVGLAVAGFVTPDRDRVRFAPHLPWRQAPVAENLAHRLGLPVVLEHDTNAAAVAEHRHGVAAGSAVCALLAIGTGIGGALLIDGELFRGAHGIAPEWGHLRVVPDGRSCPCGKRGCWERYCSGTALVDTVRERVGQHARSSLAQRIRRGAGVTGLDVAAAASDGDGLALAAMAELADWLGEGLAMVADVFDPELLVIGGGVAGSAELFLDAARERFEASITGAGFRPTARLRVARFGENASIVGAAVLAADRAARG